MGKHHIENVKLAQKLQKAGSNILFCFEKSLTGQFNSLSIGPTPQESHLIQGKQRE